MKKVEKIVDAITGEETFVERDETAAEKELRLEAIAKAEAALAEAQAKAAAKAALLDRLGITADEAKLLLGGN
jgi:hypothetical protein